MTGSGLFTNKGAVQPRFIEGKGGVAGEVGDLRQDVASALKYMCAITVAEFTDALATATDNLMEATASQLAARRLLPDAALTTGALTQATITSLLAGGPRQLQFVTAGSTPAHQPAAATVEGWDERGAPQTEVVPLKQEVGEFLSTRFWSNLKHIDLGEGGGTGATLAIGLGGKLGLASNPKLRAGRKAVIQEVSGGSVVTTGTVNRAEDGTAAGVTGTVDLVTPPPLMPTTETLVVAIDGGADLTVTFDNPADLAAIVVAINAVCDAGFAAAGGTGSAFLLLTSPTTGASSSIDIKAASTSLTILGLTAGETKGEEGTAAVVTGTVDLVAPTPVMPTTETLVVSIDDGADLTVTFASPADRADIIGAINAVCGTGFASASTDYLQLTSTTTGAGSSINIKAASTSLDILGLTAGETKGLGNGLYGSYTPHASLDGSTDFALTYEYVPD